MKNSLQFEKQYKNKIPTFCTNLRTCAVDGAASLILCADILNSLNIIYKYLWFSSNHAVPKHVIILNDGKCDVKQPIICQILTIRVCVASIRLHRGTRNIWTRNKRPLSVALFLINTIRIKTSLLVKNIIEVHEFDFFLGMLSVYWFFILILVLGITYKIKCRQYDRATSVVDSNCQQGVLPAVHHLGYLQYYCFCWRALQRHVYILYI